MSEHVWVYVRRDSLNARPERDTSLHRAASQAAPTASYEHGLLTIFGKLRARPQPALHCFKGERADRHDASDVSFSDHPDNTFGKIDVAAI
jgi:hypothetical protein